MLFPNLVKYHVYDGSRLPPFAADAYEYILAGNGLVVRTETPFFTALVPAVTFPVRGLAPLRPQFPQDKPGHRHRDQGPVDFPLAQAERAGIELAEGLETVRGGQHEGRDRNRRKRPLPVLQDGSQERHGAHAIMQGVGVKCGAASRDECRDPHRHGGDKTENP